MKNKLGFTAISLVLAFSSTQSLANGEQRAPMHSKPKHRIARVAPWNWAGAYIGAHVGAVLGEFDVSNPYGTSIYGDCVRTPGLLGGLQLGYNWQNLESNLVYGLEAQISGLDAQGTNTAFAYTGRYISSNVCANPDVSGLFTGRVGMALGTGCRALAYIKGGVAFLNGDIGATNNNQFFGTFPITQSHNCQTKWGGTVGAGIEVAVKPSCSIKLEYDYLGIAKTSIDAPNSILVNPDFETTSDVAGRNADVKQHMHQVLLGLNYFFYPHDRAHCFPSSSYCAADRTGEVVADFWMLEAGLRYDYSWGRFQKDLPDLATVKTALVSRLVYDDVKAHSGELFGRLDTRWKVFLKGLVGVGRITDGKMNDEDWGLPPEIAGIPLAYSNTLSDLDSTSMHYGTIDLGYDICTGPDYRLGLFVGYNHIEEQYEANDLVQIGLPELNESLSDTVVITETDKWDAMRLGLAARLCIHPNWRLDIDAAYLPYVKFRGEDDHWLRGLVDHEVGKGRGVQFSAVANYRVTPQFLVGVGGRYWAAWSTDGSDETDVDEQVFKWPRTDTYRYERKGVFVQASYAFGY